MKPVHFRQKPRENRKSREAFCREKNREVSPYPWASLYYRIRRKAGLPAVTAGRRNQQQILHPGENWRENLKQEDDLRVRRAVLCLAAGILLAILAGAAGPAVRTVIRRPAVGQDTLETEIDAEYDGENYQVPMSLASRLYTAEELTRAKETAARNAEKMVLAGNAAWNQVSEDLDFDSGTGVPGISVSWSSSDTDQIAADGTVTCHSRGTAAKKPVVVTAVFEYEQEQWERTYRAVVVPRKKTKHQSEESILAGELNQAAADRSQEMISLPLAAGGKAIRYPAAGAATPWLLLLLGMAAAGACMLLPVQNNRQAEKKRSEELMLEYPELVMNLTVLMSAGLSVRAAWENMVVRYQYRCTQGEPHQIVYEEMTYVRNLMQQGTYEEEAYPEFGRRCGLPPYLRLGTLLGHNVRRGSQGILPLMRAEADRALDSRLRSARKRGEEISSRMLLPMMLLLGLVLVMLMAPAFMSF